MEGIYSFRWKGRNMKIQIIAEASTRDERLLNQWGLSVLVDNDVLFDTFSNPETIKYNLKKYNVEIHEIKYIVISHEHHDHTGGLWWLLQENSDVTVFILKQFSDDIKNRIKEYGCRLIEVNGHQQIKENIFTTGALKGRCRDYTIYEQSLIIKEEKLSIITGCSHPGLLPIISHVTALFPGEINLIAGGFHLPDKSVTEIHTLIHDNLFIDKVKKIAPCHCTGEKAVKIFEQVIPDKVLKVNTGTFINTEYLE